MNKICLAIGAVMLLSSCHSQRNVLYLQDNVIDQSEVIENAKNIRIQPRDQISIMVSCKEPQLAVIFNLLQTNQRLGSSAVPKVLRRPIPVEILRHIQWTRKAISISRCLASCMWPA